MIITEIRPYSLSLWFTNSRRQFTARRAKYKKDPFDISTSCGGSSVLNDGKIYLIGVFDGKPATLIHELAHVCINVFLHVGLPVNEDTSEAFCYLLDDLYSQCVGGLE